MHTFQLYSLQKLLGILFWAIGAFNVETAQIPSTPAGHLKFEFWRNGIASLFNV